MYTLIQIIVCMLKSINTHTTINNLTGNRNGPWPLSIESGSYSKAAVQLNSIKRWSSKLHHRYAMVTVPLFVLSFFRVAAALSNTDANPEHMDLYAFVREQTDQLKQSIDRKTDLILAVVKKEARRLQAKNEQYLDAMSKKLEAAMGNKSKTISPLEQESVTSTSGYTIVSENGSDGDIAMHGSSPSPMTQETDDSNSYLSPHFPVSIVTNRKITFPFQTQHYLNNIYFIGERQRWRSKCGIPESSATATANSGDSRSIASRYHSKQKNIHFHQLSFIKIFFIS